MKKTYLKSISVVFLVGVSLFISPSLKDSLAQEPFPIRPITTIRKSAAGGMADVMMRVICKAAEKELGQTFVIENKPGANGIIAMTYISKAKPDGYILGDASTSNYINVPHMQRVTYNPLTDFTDIIVDYKYTHALCVRSDSPFKTFEDVIAFARKNPGKFNYGNSGIGTTQHIVMERIALKEGIKWRMVPFNSGAESVVACLGGHVEAVAQGPADLVQHIKAGKLRLLLALNDTRWKVAPNVPAVLEKYGFYGLSFHSIFGPKGLPEHVREILHNAFKKAMSAPSFIEAANTSNIEVNYMSGKDYEKAWKAEYEEMGKILDAMGLRVK